MIYSGRKFALALFFSLMMLSTSALYAAGNCLLNAMFIFPLYYVLSLLFQPIEFSFLTGLKYIVLKVWIWDSFIFIVLFVEQVLLGKPAPDRSKDLKTLSNLPEARLLMPLSIIALLYYNPFLIYGFQDVLLVESIDLPHSIVKTIELFLDASTFGFFSAFDISLGKEYEFQSTFIAHAFYYVTGVVFAIVTITVIWGLVFSSWGSESIEDPLQSKKLDHESEG